MGSRLSPEYRRLWKAERKKGIPRMVPSTPAARRVKTLLRLGASTGAIAECAEVSKQLVCRLRDEPTFNLNRLKVAAILRVTLDDVFERPNPDGFVPKIGAKRRMQALQCLGHSMEDIGASVGESRALVNSILNSPGDWITRAKADKAKAAYAALSDTPGASHLTAARAAAKGWLPPVWWDDDTIDRVDVTPDTSTTVEHDRIHIDDVEFLIEQGMYLDQVARRLGITRNTLQIKLGKDRWARQDLLDRMVRNRDIQQGESVAS